MFLSGCSAAETAETAEGSAAPETPVTQSPRAPSGSAFPVSAPDPGAAVLVTQMEDADGGSFAVHGLRSGAEALTFHANCAQASTVTVDVANIGPVTFSCGQEGATTTATVDVRPAAGIIDVAVTGAEGVPWGMTITEAELP
ncbi:MULTISPECIES: hypothetical protein [unclassified Arthrobacter]|uniref:hypothetical protein n=1 Tax=unclassified Arthrobacter TaxID=235627 RepID=UPI001D14509D|nr:MULTISPECIES: hypothetical protein [unclassified Arthrobacter]MCC3291431.1 hypothetical protein [Arthrobacter sp. zg-Y1110]MCC3301195.1 hypothetical protein [Arthrobacter sp. zg-Y895]MCC3302442.1 hypothetical protein [Arthrobacter sp. zg-Y895]UWX83848.1 hypothetical protein N2K99_10010 [Arthrobacter sp. zg-Y1110]